MKVYLVWWGEYTQRDVFKVFGSRSLAEQCVAAERLREYREYGRPMDGSGSYEIVEWEVEGVLFETGAARGVDVVAPRPATEEKPTEGGD